MNQVKSKYKNPDQFIERLKEDIKREQRFAKEWRDEFYNSEGNFWFDYESGITKDVILDLTLASKSRIGQFVNLRGEIIAYKKNDNGNYTVTMALGRARLREKK